MRISSLLLSSCPKGINLLIIITPLPNVHCRVLCEFNGVSKKHKLVVGWPVQILILPMLILLWVNTSGMRTTLDGHVQPNKHFIHILHCVICSSLLPSFVFLLCSIVTQHTHGRSTRRERCVLQLIAGESKNTTQPGAIWSYCCSIWAVRKNKCCGINEDNTGFIMTWYLIHKRIYTHTLTHTISSQNRSCWLLQAFCMWTVRGLQKRLFLQQLCGQWVGRRLVMYKLKSHGVWYQRQL